jgi:hypothetical protein
LVVQACSCNISLAGATLLIKSFTKVTTRDSFLLNAMAGHLPLSVKKKRLMVSVL